jgi:hypothetical protein
MIDRGIIGKNMERQKREIKIKGMIHRAKCTSQRGHIQEEKKKKDWGIMDIAPQK